MRKNTFFTATADTTDHFGILRGNLRESVLRQELACEQALYHIRETAAEIAAVCEDAQEIASLLREKAPVPNEESADLSADFPAVSRNLLALHRRGNEFFLRMTLFRELGGLMLRKNPLFLADRYTVSEPILSEAAGKISYQQNHYSDRAYLLFAESGKVTRPKAVYRGNFTEVCEDVYNGVSEYGILPAGNSSEGKLLRFVSLIETYELKIVASCTVLSDNGTANEFVLLAKSADLLSYSGEKAFLQFSVVPEWRETLRELLSAAEFCSLYPERLDSLPARDGASLSYYPVFRLDGSDLLTFYTYLSVDLPQAVPIGLYQNLTEIA